MNSTDRSLTEQVTTSITQHLFDNVTLLDRHSIHQTLKNIAFQPQREDAFRPTAQQLREAEAKITMELSNFMQSDISIPIVSLFKLNYEPTRLLEELNQMEKLSFIKKDQCLRTASALVDYLHVLKERGEDYQEPVKLSLLYKVLE